MADNGKRKKKPRVVEMNKWQKWFVFALLLVAVCGVYYLGGDHEPKPTVDFDVLVRAQDQGVLDMVELDGFDVTARIRDDVDIERALGPAVASQLVDGARRFQTRGEIPQALMDSFLASASRGELALTDEDPSERVGGGGISGWWSILITLAILGVILIQLRALIGVRFDVDSIDDSVPDITLDDVVGHKSVKRDLKAVVAAIQDPERFERRKVPFPRGVLLEGPPGTGKTMLAQALAGSAGAHFIAVSATELQSKFHGGDAKNLRELFETAAQHAPCIVFIDEIDAIAGHRETSGNRPWTNQGLNQLLALMDGFNEREQIVVIAATNLAEALDEALTRPGRFDRVVRVDLPTLADRIELIRRLAAKYELLSCDAEALARRCMGASGAFITSVFDRAARAALMEDELLSSVHVQQALRELQMGDTHSHVMSDEARRMTALHEVGHALVAHDLGLTIDEVTIVPRGPAGGMTVILLDDEEGGVTTRRDCEKRLTGLMGGLAAETLESAGSHSAGVANDLQQATHLARLMEGAFGMGDSLAVCVDHATGSYMEGIPEAIMAAVEAAVERRLQQARRQAREILERRREDLEAVVAALLEHETLTGVRFRAILAARQLPSLAVETSALEAAHAAEVPHADKAADMV